MYELNGIVCYRASQLGGCVRGLALARQGYDRIAPPASMFETFEKGREAEREVWAKGIISGTAQEFIQLPISETIRITGHLDCWEKENGRVYEIKSQSAAEWKPIQEGNLWYRYKYQIGVYMHATGLPLTVVRVRRKEGGGIDGEEREEFDVPPVTLGEIRQRVFKVEMLARRDLSEVKCEPLEFPCPYFYTHANPETREQVDDTAAVVLARQYKDARLVAEVANGRVKASREALLEYVGDRTRLKLADGTLLTRYKVGGRHVEYDRDEYWALKVTTTKRTGVEGGEADRDSV